MPYFWEHISYSPQRVGRLHMPLKIVSFPHTIMNVKVKLVILILSIFILSTKSEQILKQVVILSRHNVRTPLAKNLDQITQKPWPQWKEKSGQLTDKGVLLEGYMGEFFASWLFREGLLCDRCPNEEDFFVYANVKQRTRASAQAFVDSGFPACNVTVHHKGSDNKDPVFDPVLHNTTSVFKNIAMEQMLKRLKSLHLNMSYEDIENILDYKESELCTVDKKCDLETDKNKIINVTPGKKPSILGPLKISNSAIDAFIMAYYQGFPLNDVAWGQLTNTQQWRAILDLSKGYHNVIFNTTIVAKDISKPLIAFMSNIFLRNNFKPKATLLMGHDANIYTVLNSIAFKPYHLKNQYELAPVGGKIVFQRWFHSKLKKDFLKVNYVYATSEQMRGSAKLSLQNPPVFELLQLDGCAIDENGFCFWDDFVTLLKGLL